MGAGRSTGTIRGAVPHFISKCICVMDKAQSYFVSLTSMSVAGVCTAPFDTIKTRLQMQQGAQRGFLAMGVHIVRTESARGLFKGVTPMLGRALTHGALRMSLYTPAKSVLCGALGSPGAHPRGR